MLLRVAIILICLCKLSFISAQHPQQPSASLLTMDTSLTNISELSSRYVQTISKKASQYYNDVTEKTLRTLEKLAKWEAKIKTILEKTSPETAQRLFANDQITFAALLQKYREGKAVTDDYQGQLNEYRDKVNTTIKYLDDKKEQLKTSVIKPLEEAKAKTEKLNRQLKNIEAIQQLIKDRKKQLISLALQHLNKNKYLQKINKESWYYAEALKNYKTIFSDSKRTEELAVKLLQKIPAFREFFARNSLMSSLFSSAGSGANPNGTVGLLQSRAAVNAAVQSQIGAAGSNPRQAFQELIQSAQGQLNQLRQKISGFTGGGSDVEIPDFKVNSERSKKFLQKISLSANIQTTKHNNSFPVTSDLGLSIEYKPSQKLIFGIGGAYRVGWGSSISNIHITHQGVGLRSFLDCKLKRNFFLSGGYEQNYFSEIRNIQQLRNLSAWKSSALLGVCKKYKIGKKRNGEMKLVYDFFSKTKIPVTSSFIFRVSFGLK